METNKENSNKELASQKQIDFLKSLAPQGVRLIPEEYTSLTLKEAYFLLGFLLRRTGKLKPRQANDKRPLCLKRRHRWTQVERKKNGVNFYCGRCGQAKQIAIVKTPYGAVLAVKRPKRINFDPKTIRMEKLRKMRLLGNLTSI